MWREWREWRECTRARSRACSTAARASPPRVPHRRAVPRVPHRRAVPHRAPALVHRRTYADGAGRVQASLLLQIGHEFFLQVPGRHSHDRPPPFDDDEDGEFKGNGNVYAGEGGSWFTSSPPLRVNYEQYCKSRYR